MANKFSPSPAMVKALLYAYDLHISAYQPPHGDWFRFPNQFNHVDIPVAPTVRPTLENLAAKGLLKKIYQGELIPDMIFVKDEAYSITAAGIEVIKPYVEKRALAYTPGMYDAEYVSVEAEIRRAAYEIMKSFRRYDTDTWLDILAEEDHDLYMQMESRI